MKRVRIRVSKADQRHRELVQAIRELSRVMASFGSVFEALRDFTNSQDYIRIQLNNLMNRMDGVEEVTKQFQISAYPK